MRGKQIATVLACYLGWALDAFDYFIVVFVIDNVARTFHATLELSAAALWLTLGFRPVGAYIFGRLADRHGRKPVLMGVILFYSVVELASAASPSIVVFLLLRALFGIALGGEWGVGAALTMESIPRNWRGPVSGLLQTGYPTGYLLASVLFLALPVLGWRGMFVVGALPALLIAFIWLRVDESPDWLAQRALARSGAVVAPTASLGSVLRQNAGLVVFAIGLMACFNFFSHGSQDLYPKIFLRNQLGFHPATVTIVVVLYNLGAMAGGLFFGTLSERIGRRRAIAIASLLALPLLPLWAYSTTPLRIGIGAVLMQFCIQGAWGVVPAYLNELSPAAIRATFPGLTYQLGNLIASPNGNLQLLIAHHTGGSLALPLALVVGTVAVLIAVLATFGPDSGNSALGRPGALPLDPAGAERPRTRMT